MLTAALVFHDGGNMIYIFIILLVFLWVYSLTFRLIFSHPFIVLYYAYVDFYCNFRKYRFIPKKPFINVYVGLFGQGKTLSAVHDLKEFYSSYNGKIVYDDRFKKFVVQEVLVMSNVHLKDIPYKKLYSLQQLVEISRYRHILDACKNKRTVTIVLLDEASTQLNSRSFKTNFSPSTLNMLLCSRHALIHGFYLTSQRFGHMDALMRQVSQNVIECNKIWRFVKNVYYDAWEYENAVRPKDCKMLRVSGFFARKEDFNSYDTLAVVDNLIKCEENGEMISDSEKLARQGQKVIVNLPMKKKRR